MTSVTSTGRHLAISSDISAALEGAELLETFTSLPRLDQINYINWVEEGGPKARAGRIRQLLRIVHISKKAL